MPPPQPPPQMVPVPSSGWLLSTFVLESFTRIDELNAKVTSTFGSILKMDSTKKVTKKLAGADAATALWMSSVGNELGQVLMSVLTATEGYGLRDMTRGLQERYQLAGKEPPQVLYVDRDCCQRDGGTCTAAALFPAWPHLTVRLDIWHFIRRLAAGVTSESHPLYPEFMRSLSSCIFEWDLEDLSLLETALQADGSRRTPSSKEMGRHCRRGTRGAQETERLLGDGGGVQGGHRYHERPPAGPAPHGGDPGDTEASHPLQLLQETIQHVSCSDTEAPTTSLLLILCVHYAGTR